MKPVSQFGLLRTRRLLPLFVTQFFGAFNDNVYKQALLIIFVYSAIADQYDTDLLNNFAAALFILPFLLFSATAGAMADKFDKAYLIRRVKVAEILVAVLIGVALLTQNVSTMLLVLFLLGVQSTFFGPLKFALLPQQLHRSELVGGNAMVEMGTLVAILLGTLGGGLLGNPELLGGLEQVVVWLSVTVVLTATVGFIASLQIAPAPPSFEGEINWNPFTETVNLIRLSMVRKAVFRSVLGVSWFWLIGSIFLTQIPSLTKNHLYGDGTVVTALLTLFTITVAIGSLVCEKLSGRKVEIGLVPLGAAGMSIWGIDAYFSISAIEAVPMRNAFEFLSATGTARLLLDLSLIGISAGMFVVPMQALIQQRTPPAETARVIAANNILNSLAIVLGAVISIVWLSVLDYNIPSLFLLVAILTALVAVYIFATVPEFVMRFIIWLVGHSMYRVRHIDLDKIPEKGPAVLVCNHVSFVDFMLLAGAIHRPLRFVMDRHYYELPVVHFVCRIGGAVPITKRESDPEMYEEAFEKISDGLNQGELFCIFPEGRLTNTGEILEFQRGIERIIRESPVPVVPVALGGMWGSYFSRAESHKKLSKRVSITIGDSVEPDAVTAPALQVAVSELRGSDR